MGDIVTNLLTYQDYLDLTEQTIQDVTELEISILVVQQVINQRLLCLDISDITTINSDGLAVLKSWTVLYISNKLSNEVEIKTKPFSDNLLTEIDDGFVKEVYAERSNKLPNNVNTLKNLDDLWNLFRQIVVDFTVATDNADGLGVAKRVKTSPCVVVSQGTS
jgi:ABC-type transporter Mla MlaB component